MQSCQIIVKQNLFGLAQGDCLQGDEKLSVTCYAYLAHRPLLHSIKTYRRLATIPSIATLLSSSIR